MRLRNTCYFTTGAGFTSRWATVLRLSLNGYLPHNICTNLFDCPLFGEHTNRQDIHRSGNPPPSRHKESAQPVGGRSKDKLELHQNNLRQQRCPTCDFFLYCGNSFLNGISGRIYNIRFIYSQIAKLLPHGFYQFDICLSV